jgi:hypothetical protein
VKDVNKNFEKGLTLLTPRRDHVMRQLGRIGLKTIQLNTDKLIALFYDYYNDPFKGSSKAVTSTNEVKKTAQQPQAAKTISQIATQSTPAVPQPVPAQVPSIAPQPPAQSASQPQNPAARPLNRNVPFAVEELPA